MKKFSKKVSLLLAAFAVCVMAACISMPVKAAAAPLQLSNDPIIWDKEYPTTNYIFLESKVDLGQAIELKYSTSDPNVNSGSNVLAAGVSLNGKWIYIVNQRFSPAQKVYFKYQNSDVFVGVTAPSAITSLAQTNATANSVTVSWSPVSGADGYYVYAATSGGNLTLKGTVAGGATTSYTVGALAQNGVYAVGIAPYKSNGTGINQHWSPSGKTTLRTASGKISGVKLAASSGSYKKYQIAWSENGATYADGFEIMITDKSGKKKLATATEERYLSYVFTNAKLRTQAWKVKVRAYTRMDNGTKAYGAWSAEKVIVPNAYIKKIKQTSRYSNTIKITWGKVSGAKNYTLYRSTKQNGKYKKVKTVKGTSCTLTQSANGKWYYYYVKANGVKVGKKKYNSTSLKKQDWYGYKLTKVTRYY